LTRCEFDITTEETESITNVAMFARSGCTEIIAHITPPPLGALSAYSAVGVCPVSFISGISLASSLAQFCQSDKIGAFPTNEAALPEILR